MSPPPLCGWPGPGVRRPVRKPTRTPTLGQGVATVKSGGCSAGKGGLEPRQMKAGALRPGTVDSQHAPQPGADVANLIGAYRVRHAIVVPFHRVTLALEQVDRLW